MLTFIHVYLIKLDLKKFQAEVKNCSSIFKNCKFVTLIRVATTDMHILTPLFPHFYVNACYLPQ
jgi:hypothetical protein